MNPSEKTVHLLLSMLRVGLIGFGGGNALIPIIEKEVVERYGLVTKEEYEEDVLVASITPGALPVEIAGGVGRRCMGPKGLLLGSFTLALPGVVLTLLLSSVITLASDEVLLQIRYLAVGVTAFISCLLTQYILTAARMGRENGIFRGSMAVVLLVFAFTCGKNLQRLLGFDAGPMVVLSTVKVFAIALVLMLLFGKRDGEKDPDGAPNRAVLVRVAKELGYILAVTLLFFAAACFVTPETLDYAAKGFLSSLMSFGGGDAYLTVADGLFVQTGIVGESDFFGYIVPVANILPGSILCKTLAGVGYFAGFERTGSVAGGVLVATAGFFVSLLASCGVFALAGYFHERFRNLYVIRGIKRWIRPIVSGLMLTVILSLVVQNQKLGVESGLGIVPPVLMIGIYGLDMGLKYVMKLTNGSIVFLSALLAFIGCNLA